MSIKEKNFPKVLITATYFPLCIQRDGRGREEGGGFRMGNTCVPVVDSF